MRSDDEGDNIDWPRLGRYVTGESSPAESAAVEAWIAEDPSRRELVASLTDAWETAGRRPTASGGPQVDAAWVKMSNSIDALAVPVSLVSRRRGPSYAVLRVAAVVLIVIGGVFAWRRLSITDPLPGVATIAARNFETKPGERRTIVLDDSTEIVLGVVSRLSVAADYGTTSRDVSLEGEALFRVRHDAQRPFRVKAGGRMVEDLGTEFAVRAYAPTDTVRVVVTQGSVSLARDGTTGIVKAGEIGLLPVDGPVSVARASNADTLLAWSRGRIVFDNAPMSRVAEELRRWYGVRVSFADSTIASRHVSVTFSGDSLDDVLQVLAASVDARFTRADSGVVFRRTGKTP